MPTLVDPADGDMTDSFISYKVALFIMEALVGGSDAKLPPHRGEAGLCLGPSFEDKKHICNIT